MEEIKALDSVAGRLKGVPWYMPYLWAKEERVGREKARGEYQRRKQGEGGRKKAGMEKGDSIRGIPDAGRETRTLEAGSKFVA